MSSYRYCRVPPTSPAAQAAGFVANRLEGAPIHTLQGGRSIVPLLHPQQHGLPFALTLELHAAPQPGAPQPQPPTAPDRSLYALHYILAGSGQLAASRGIEQLQAGDAVLMHAGAAACRANASDQQAATGSLRASGPFEMAELVAYIPQQLFEQQEGQQGEAAALSTSLQSLEQLAQGGVGEQQSSEQRLPAELVDALLAGAKDIARQALRADTAADTVAAEAATAGAPAQPWQQHVNSSGGSSSGSSNSSSSSTLGPLRLLQVAASGLAAWWQGQQGRTCPVTKKTLGELTAFRLPNQTNRLAVQFDPFSRPQVPFLSGIEVFERGHRTTPHVHPHAHELFFILAGEGTGFCNKERFPGDVVVFRPGALHGIDNSDEGRMYCLELMVPNEEFAEFVRQGTDTGSLAADDMCVLASIGCR